MEATPSARVGRPRPAARRSLSLALLVLGLAPPPSRSFHLPPRPGVPLRRRRLAPERSIPALGANAAETAADDALAEAEDAAEAGGVVIEEVRAIGSGLPPPQTASAGGGRIKRRLERRGVADYDAVDAETSRGQGVPIGTAGSWRVKIFPGDYLVHQKYGIGRFEGLLAKRKKPTAEEYDRMMNERQAEIARARKEGANLSELLDAFEDPDATGPGTLNSVGTMVTVLEVTYADGTLHVPMDKTFRLGRYRSAADAGTAPKLSKMVGDTWRKQLQKAAASTRETAQEVLALYATRETLARTPCAPAKEGKVDAFSETFPYQPTTDQVKCFQAVEQDMVWRPRPMDRLVCGDVGFGKTEVALRALYRCVQNGRQAALLAPTGVLAAQHFKNVLARMDSLGVKSALLRGGTHRNSKGGKEIRERIQKGELQLCVGTHALLAQSIQFHNLGLLVIDEEQRFGVKQKERLKMICEGVDVLTLSATPIPRTLQMSLSGLRDTSTIRTPPPMRQPVKTVVERYNPDTVSRAIRAELARGGQCFYVVPRISMMDDAEQNLLDCVPDLRIVKAHGRMGRGAAEENVARFAAGEGDVLLATTVIENGIDIPSVNTILVDHANTFGMSTLYQLRGRVGRSNLQAYAYLFVSDVEGLTEGADARLTAMADLTELGAGFDVASRDLEIRGAGSLLGVEQSGTVGSVGFDLYMKMLKRAIRQLKGLTLTTVPRTNVLLPGGEGAIEGEGGRAFRIPEKYIADAEERTRQEGLARLAEDSPAIVKLTEEWKERYGPIPATLKRSLKNLHLHSCTRQLGIDLIGLARTPSSGKSKDGIFRCPHLRPRHWAAICATMPEGKPPAGLSVFFPARHSPTGIDARFADASSYDSGGDAFELDSFDLDFMDVSSMTDKDDDEAEDEEETLRDAMSVADMREVDPERHSCFVVERLSAVKQGQRATEMLKALLPIVNDMAKKRKENQTRAKLSVEARNRKAEIKKMAQGGTKRNGYYY